MNIIIKDKINRTWFEGTYIGTFSTKEFRTKIPFKYPVELNSFDAEKMLQILIMICHNSKVHAYFKEHIPSPFFVGSDERDQYIPLNPLLNYLAGPSKINFLDWKPSQIEYCKSMSGVVIRCFSKVYIFPYSNKFSLTFLNYFGKNRWADTDYKRALTAREFGYGHKDLSICLSNFTTWFIASECYDKLCIDLMNICKTLEQILDETIFKWNDISKRETNLLYIMNQRSDFSQ